MKSLCCENLCNACFGSIVIWSHVVVVQRVVNIFDQAHGLAAFEALLGGDEAHTIGGRTSRLGNHQKDSFAPEEYELTWK